MILKNEGITYEEKNMVLIPEEKMSDRSNSG